MLEFFVCFLITACEKSRKVYLPSYTLELRVNTLPSCDEKTNPKRIFFVLVCSCFFLFSCLFLFVQRSVSYGSVGVSALNTSCLEVWGKKVK